MIQQKDRKENENESNEKQTGHTAGNPFKEEETANEQLTTEEIAAAEQTHKEAMTERD